MPYIGRKIQKRDRGYGYLAVTRIHLGAYFTLREYRTIMEWCRESEE